MPIPPYDELMLPVLRYAATKTWHMRELVERIADDLALTSTERIELLPGGSATVIASRVAWAKTYLKKAGLVRQPGRSLVEATPQGRAVLESRPARIDRSILERSAEFREFVQARPAAERVSRLAKGDAEVSSQATPDEQIDSASALLEAALRDELLTRLLESSPKFFEKAIIGLLLAMGYGGPNRDASEHLGGSGDGGVDGLIREDQLGLDRVYLQAKRYKPGNVVGSESIRGFVGALVGKGAQKGVFITTSSFSDAAKAAATQSGSLRVVLLDGQELTDLMIRFNVGVRLTQTVEIKRVDSDYFAGEPLD